MGAEQVSVISILPGFDKSKAMYSTIMSSNMKQEKLCNEINDKFH